MSALVLVLVLGGCGAEHSSNVSLSRPPVVSPTTVAAPGAADPSPFPISAGLTGAAGAVISSGPALRSQLPSSQRPGLAVTPSPKNRAVQGLPPGRCGGEAVPGDPNDGESGESDAVLAALHARCFQVIGAAVTDVALSGGRRVVIGVNYPTGDAFGRRLFFFQGDHFLGTDSSGPHEPGIITVARLSDTTLVASYSFAAPCCPGRFSPVTFLWRPKSRPTPESAIPTA